MIETFDEWYARCWESDFDYNGSYTRKNLEDSWNSAIKSCELIIASKYDEQEPWLEPGEVSEILKEPRPIND